MIIRNIDQLGRVVIPKEMRRQLGIKEGQAVSINLVNDCVVIQKHDETPEAIRIAKRLRSIIGFKPEFKNNKSLNFSLDFIINLLEEEFNNGK